MRDDTLVEHGAVLEIYVDGFSDHLATRNGMMTCSGFRIHEEWGEPVKVRVVRLIWPSAATEEAIADAREAQSPQTPVAPAKRAGRH